MEAGCGGAASVFGVRDALEIGGSSGWPAGHQWLSGQAICTCQNAIALPPCKNANSVSREKASQNTPCLHCAPHGAASAPSKNVVTSQVTFPPQVGLARHRCTGQPLRNFAKKGSLSLLCSPTPPPKPCLTSTAKPIFDLHLPRPRPASAPAPAPTAFPALYTISHLSAIRLPSPSSQHHPLRSAMPQLTSSFASAAAGQNQNRDPRGSGRSDSTRGTGSGDW